MPRREGDEGDEEKCAEKEMEKTVSLWGGGIVLLCGRRQQSARESVLYPHKVCAGALKPRLKQNSFKKNKKVKGR